MSRHLQDCFAYTCVLCCVFHEDKVLSALATLAVPKTVLESILKLFFFLFCFLSLLLNSLHNIGTYFNFYINSHFFKKFKCMRKELNNWIQKFVFSGFF
jgi:hypothetical protein